MNDRSRLVQAHIPLLSAKDKETTVLILLKFEMKKVRLQFQRLEEDWRTEDASPKSSGTQIALAERQTRLFADIHFLLVCLKKLRSVFFRMRRYFPDSEELKSINDRYGQLLEDCSRMRDNLEHIDDRPGKGEVSLGSTFGTVFQFGKRQLNLDKAFTTKIESFYKELESAYDAILIRRRKESGDHLVHLTGVITIPGPPTPPRE